MARVTANGYLEQKAYNELKDMIIRGELKPGDQVIQDQIAQRIGVSRTPLRRAMAELERDFLLETTNQGVFVRDLSADFLRSLWEVRAVLEGLACRLAAYRIDDATIAYLRTLFESAYKKYEEDGIDEPYRRADIIFHTKLAEVSDNPVLKQNFDSSQVLTIALKQGLLRTPFETHQEHMDILDALEKRDGMEAEKLMLLHHRKTILKIKNNQFKV